MLMIDKNMYTDLKNWYDENRPKNQFLMYVNSNDRILTDMTLRKLMREIDNEDPYGEDYYTALYSAQSFYHNMRDYYSYIADCYMSKPSEDEPIETIIKDYPPTCGWITLIVEDVESLSRDAEKMQELLKSFVAFASKRSNVILVGNGDYKDVFGGCEYALNEIADGLNAKEEDNQLMICCYDQKADPDRESIVFDTLGGHRDELNYYWDTIYDQLEKEYFDYDAFKVIYKETMEYIIPRVTKDTVYREDLELIEKLDVLSHEKHKNIVGCKQWEFEAARQFAMGLHEAIINWNDDNDSFSKGEIVIYIEIDDCHQDHGAIHISGYICDEITINVRTACRIMDDLAETIQKCTYKGDSKQAWVFLRNYALDENDRSNLTTEEIEKCTRVMDALQDGIKNVADKTLNKELATKVRKYKGNYVKGNDQTQKTEDKKEFKILRRNYDVAVDKIKGYDKLGKEQASHIDCCKLSRFIVVLDDARYTKNADGELEMTQASQGEYDKFVSDIRQKVIGNEITILDEGYGDDEDELEWHITCCAMDPETEDKVVGIMEFDTCVRIE